MEAAVKLMIVNVHNILSLTSREYNVEIFCQIMNSQGGIRTLRNIRKTVVKIRAF